MKKTLRNFLLVLGLMFALRTQAQSPKQESGATLVLVNTPIETLLQGTSLSATDVRTLLSGTWYFAKKQILSNPNATDTENLEAMYIPRLSFEAKNHCNIADDKGLLKSGKWHYDTEHKTLEVDIWDVKYPDDNPAVFENVHHVKRDISLHGVLYKITNGEFVIIQEVGNEYRVMLYTKTK